MATTANAIAGKDVVTVPAPFALGSLGRVEGPEKIGRSFSENFDDNSNFAKGLTDEFRYGGDIETHCGEILFTAGVEDEVKRVVSHVPHVTGPGPKEIEEDSLVEPSDRIPMPVFCN